MFGDIGIGIFLSMGITQLFGLELNVVYIIAGIIFTLLPDIDMVIYPFPTLKKIFNVHRDWTHLPAIYIPIAITLFFIAGPVWVCFLVFGVFFHLIHDTLWLGTGIKWLWPFSHRTYKSFPDKGIRITSVPWISWKSKEEEFQWRWGENIGIAYPHWIRLFYFRPTIVSISEYGLFIVSLIVLYYTI